MSFHPPPGGHRRKTVQCQLSVNKYQLLVELASTRIKLLVSSKSPSSFQLGGVRGTFQEKLRFQVGCFWLRSRIRLGAHNKLCEAEQLLVLFQFNLLFALKLYQSSLASSNLHCHCTKLKSMKVLAASDLCLDKANLTRFLVIAHRKRPTLCS